MELSFEEQDLIVLLKMKAGRQWHPEQKKWSLPDTPENRAWVGISDQLDQQVNAPAIAPKVVRTGHGAAEALARFTDELPKVVRTVSVAQDAKLEAATYSDIWMPFQQGGAERLVSPSLAATPLTPDRLRIYKHPALASYLCLNLPRLLINDYLPKVKQIPGRSWNRELLVWELPYTQVTLRFLRKFFPTHLSALR